MAARWARRSSAPIATIATTTANLAAPAPSVRTDRRHTHILERRYEFSQAPGPGRLITNLFPNPDFSFHGPYAMCGKCHNLNNMVSQRQLEPARSAHQRRILLLDLPHLARHGRKKQDHLRRAPDQLRHQCGRSEWWYARLLQPGPEHLHADLPQCRAQSGRLNLASHAEEQRVERPPEAVSCSR